MAFYYSSWLKLPLSTRAKLAHEFGIAKTSSTHVQDNVVISDGYKVNDVEHGLNPDAIRSYLDSKEKDFNILWAAMVDKAEGRAPVTLGGDGTGAVVIFPKTVVEIPAEKKTRAATKPKKKGK